MTKRVLVGGPLLGEKGSSSTINRRACLFEPLITPLISASANDNNTSKGEQFILLPHSRYLQVLALETGNHVANLIPFNESSSSSSEESLIESVCLATYPTKPQNALDILGQLSGQQDKDDSSNNKTNKKEHSRQANIVDHVVLVGCSDGTLREFSLVQLLASSFDGKESERDDNPIPGNKQCGPWSLEGPCFQPRRVFQLAKSSIHVLHLVAPAGVARTDHGLLLYAITQTPTKSKDAKKKQTVSLVRLLLPPFYDESIVETKRKNQLQLWNEADNNNIKFSTTNRIQTIHKIACKEEQKDDGTADDNAPIRMEAVVRDRTQSFFSPGAIREQIVFLVVAKPTVVQVYCERLSDIGQQQQQAKPFPPVSFEMNQRLCSMAVSTNKSDIACGFVQGHIVVNSNLLAQVEEYHLAIERFQNHHQATKATTTTTKDGAKNNAAGITKPEHPSHKVINVKIHWHAHPVTALRYDPNSSPTDPILYSGGEESVLVTWQLSRGLHRPSDHLPRIAWRGIRHIVCTKRIDGAPNTNDNFLLYCDDNTLQLFESHNKVLLWKARGLALKPEQVRAKMHPTIANDPEKTLGSASQLVLHGLPDAPGLVQWYDTKQQRVTGQLVVAPFNRVSGMDRNSKGLMPEPSVTHLAMSLTANDLITIDNVPTENEYVGAVNGKFGVVPTVKFWAWTPPSQQATRKSDVASKPYQLVAAMAHPHGTGNLVSAATMASSGQYACTVSNDEKAFRIWNKARDADSENAPGARRLPVWVCHCKVTTPSGFSNHPTGENAVAFSSDGSILAIAFGHMITIWDRANVTLLTCLSHLGGEDAIDSIEFIKNDMIMCKSSQGVSIQSLFQAAELAADLSWGFTVKNLTPPATVSCAHYVANDDKVAIAVYFAQEDYSRLVVMDTMTAEPAKDHQGGNLPGAVVSLGQSGPATAKSNWYDEENNDFVETDPCPLVLCALTNKGEMFALEPGHGRQANATKSHGVSSDMKAIPTLPMNRSETEQQQPRKRRRRAANPIMWVDSGSVLDKKFAVATYGSMVDENGSATPLQTSELPSLSGGFTRAFIGRHLSRDIESSR
ncbi:Protein of unknown function (DUF2470) [Seminavis robusta]|uniref:WD repeat-containing protein 75 second beta-propeller domain-containing protein n=1 Tax=Seminavis robusta TaxID=568900 RepID=A0A9N8H3A5_9STRA|nr:Protein of unknown function (DUF2470) [Seminavis robusta]|eukprot:Sro83_g044460.1 Protein of unknown function (DUF2470) (1074) ;mRNA; f:89950-93171